MEFPCLVLGETTFGEMENNSSARGEFFTITRQISPFQEL